MVVNKSWLVHYFQLWRTQALLRGHRREPRFCFHLVLHDIFNCNYVAQVSSILQKIIFPLRG